MNLRRLSPGAAITAVLLTAAPATAATTVSGGGDTITVRDTSGVVNRLAVEPFTHDTDGFLFTPSGPAVPPAPPASAATTVSGGADTITVRDASGVVNRLAVEPFTHDTDGFLFTQAGPEVLTAGGGCVLWDEDILHPRGDMVFCAYRP